MITTHMWTGWWEDNPHGTHPQYGPCEAIVKGEPCRRPRSDHEHLETARRREDGS